MICPNGLIEIDKLKKMIKSDEYVVYLEPHDEPEDWDFRKNGIYHSPNRTQIKSIKELTSALEAELKGKGTIVYDITENYSKKHPYIGEQKTYVREEFFWEYHSNFGKKRCYKICPCTFLGGDSDGSLEIVCYEDGFNSNCFQIGRWDKTKDGYVFQSCHSRLFNYIEEEDIPTIWEALKKANEFLNNDLDEN